MRTRASILVLCCTLAPVALMSPPARAERFVLSRAGEAPAAIVVDIRGSTLSAKDLEAEQKGIDGGGTDAYSLLTWGRFLAEQIGAAAGATPTVRVDAAGQERAVVLALAENYPQAAREAGLDLDSPRDDPIAGYDAFCIHSTAQRLYILGRTELACRHGVATLLERLGYRYYSPSPRWWIAPRTKELSVDGSLTKSPRFFNVEFGTNAGHHLNHGNGTETYLWDIQEIWYAMNRTSGLRFNPGPRFSAGPFAFDFTRSVKAELERHPEYFALREDGTRDVDRPLAARQPCVSSAGMVELIVADRLALLAKQRERDRFRPMVSAEYQSGNFGGCRCADCAALGSDMDRMFTLVNAIARAVREKHADASVAVRVFGGETPTVALETNVCVSVSQPALAAKWSGKAKFVGTTFRTPGYVPVQDDRAATAAYYQESASSSSAANVRSLQAELAPAWGGLQTPMMYVATQVLWDPQVDVEALLGEHDELCFANAAGSMRSLRAKLASGRWREDSVMASMLADLAQAYATEERADVRGRVVDVMCYVHGLILYRAMEAAAGGDAGEAKGDAFYEALLPLMRFLSGQSYRSVMCPSVLAQRYCNRSALRDGREDFHWYRYEKSRPAVDPVWMDDRLPWRARPVVIRRGDPRVAATIRDDEIVALFGQDRRRYGLSE